MSGMLGGMLKGKAASKVMNGGQQTPATQPAAGQQTVSDQLFEEIFQPVKTPASNGMNLNQTEVLQLLIKLAAQPGTRLF